MDVPFEVKQVPCRSCDGMGSTPVTIPAVQVAGNIHDGDTVLRVCMDCDGEGYVDEEKYAQADWEAAQERLEAGEPILQ